MSTVAIVVLAAVVLFAVFVTALFAVVYFAGRSGRREQRRLGGPTA